MADTTALKNRIRAAIKANDNQEITGPVLQQALLDIVDELDLNPELENEAQQRQNDDSTLQQAINTERQARIDADNALGQRITDEENTRQLGNSILQQAINTEKTRAERVEQSLSQADTTLNNLITGIKNNIDNGYVYAGIAMPSTTPVSGKVFYVAVQAGTYTNFGGTAVTEGITILKYNGASWIKEQALFTDGGVFDISAYHATGGTLATYDNLEDALGTNGKNIPQSLRKGGMSVKFVQTSDSKYVQYRLMADEFTTDTTQWAIAGEGVYAENPEWVYVLLDRNSKILAGIKSDGSVEWAIGVPAPVKAYVDKQVNNILGTDNITETIDSLKEVEKFLSDFKNSDTLKALLDTKANKTDVDNTVANINANIADKYKKSNPNDSEGNVIDTNTILSIEDNPEYIKAFTDSIGRLIEAIGLDGVRKFFAGINVQGTLQCVTDNPEYVAVWLDNQNKIVFGFKTNGDTYFGYGVPSQINSLIETLKSNTETRIDTLQQSIDNNILALDYNSDTGELYALTGETSTINASMDDNGDVYLEQEII